MLIALLAASLAASAPAPVPAPAQEPHPPHRARANLTQYFSDEDYPPSAVERHIEGAVGFHLRIDAEGHVTECTVTSSSGDAALDSATCAIILGRVRYEPARDARGRAVPDTDNGRVAWRLPDEAPDEEQVTWVAPFNLEVTVSLTAAGELRCVGLLNGAPSNFGERDFCEAIRRSDAGAMLHQLGPGSAVSLLVDVGLAGAAPPARAAADRGVLLLDLRAALTVAPDGSVSNCRAAPAVTHGDIDAAQSLPGLCDMPALAVPRLFGPGGTGATRAGAVRMQFYLRDSAGRRTA